MAAVVNGMKVEACSVPFTLFFFFSVYSSFTAGRCSYHEGGTQNYAKPCTAGLIRVFVHGTTLRSGFSPNAAAISGRPECKNLRNLLKHSPSQRVFLVEPVQPDVCFTLIRSGN